MNKLKRFLEPITKTPFIYARTTFVYLWWGLNGVVQVLFIQRLTYFLEHGEKLEYSNTIWVFLVFLIVYEIIFLSLGHYGWVDTYNQTIINVEGKYLRDFIKLDNNKIEGVGTGKMVAIIK